MNIKVINFLSFLFCVLILSACSSTGKVEGKITLDGAPLANTQVELAQGQNAVPAVKTDTDGHFEFSDVQPDSYVISVTLEGEQVKCIVVVPATVEKGKVLTHDFTLDKTIYLSGGLGMLKNGEIVKCVNK